MTDTAAQTIALSVGVSALVSVACRRVGLPALIPLLLAGLGLGTSGLGVVDGASMGRSLTGFITVAIGLLIFEGALHLSRDELRRAPRAVWGLLTVGAALTWGGAAAAAHLLLGMSGPLSILLGATLIVTGPTVVQPILRLVRVTPPLHTVLAAEAILIDPVGVVATVTTLEVLRLSLLSGAHVGLAGEGMWLFAKTFLGGAGVGVLMGASGYWLLTAIDRAGRPEPHLLSLLAVGLCMTSVGVGEAVTPEGGLVAVTICGVLMARAKILGATELRAFKELLAAVLVGTLFVLLASRFEVTQIASLSWREAAFVGVLIFGVRPVSVWVSTWRSKLTTRERWFAGTFAPRGIVALSVATVAAGELLSLGASLEGGAPAPWVADLGRDAPRLELVMFVVITGSVVLASAFSPLLAWGLRVQAGEGTAVLLVGAHPLSVALAKLLAAHGIGSRIIDSNDARVTDASRSEVAALEGDATDARWMDDVGMPADTGRVIAWTGNHDVDQIVARWAEERLGQGRAAIWSSKPARGRLGATDLSRGEPIAGWIDHFEDGRAALVESAEAPRVGHLLGWIRDGRFVSSVRGAAIPEPAAGVLFVTLCETAGSATSAYARGAPPWPEARGS